MCWPGWMVAAPTEIYPISFICVLFYFWRNAMNAGHKKYVAIVECGLGASVEWWVSTFKRIKCVFLVHLVAFLFSEEICTPIDQIEQRKYKRKCYPRYNVDSFRSRTMSFILVHILKIYDDDGMREWDEHTKRHEWIILFVLFWVCVCVRDEGFLCGCVVYRYGFEYGWKIKKKKKQETILVSSFVWTIFG